MVHNIFVNLPVKDIVKTKDFFTHLGFSFNPQFSDDSSGCLVLSDNIFVMLISEPKFQVFTKKQISNAHETTEVLLAIGVESRETVKTLVQKAVEKGATIYKEPEDHGWMYLERFADLDGHQWEVAYMDAAGIPQN